MKLHKIAILFLLVAGIGSATFAQDEPAAQPKERTREDALKEGEAKSKAFDDKMEEGRKQHVKRQDKATQKRMKKNLRRAEKHSWGKEVPWYKRWFRKKKF